MKNIVLAVSVLITIAAFAFAAPEPAPKLKTGPADKDFVMTRPAPPEVVLWVEADTQKVRWNLPYDEAAMALIRKGLADEAQIRSLAGQVEKLTAELAASKARVAELEKKLKELEPVAEKKG